MLLLIVVAMALVLGLGPAPAGAFIIQETGGPDSAGNGIVIGPDGNFWVAEEFSGGVAHIGLDGTALAHFPVGGNPTGVAVGPGGKVWVTIPASKKLVWFDATAPSPTAHSIPVNAQCEPTAIVAGGDGQMYFSLPSDGSCNAGNSQIGKISDTGVGSATFASAGGGNSYDLEVAGGKLYAPDFDNGVIRRLSLGSLAVETTIDFPTDGPCPDGIAADNAGNIWVTAWCTGHIAKFPQSQNGGVVQEITPPGGTLVDPFGIVQGADGFIYVTGKDSSNVARVSPDGTQAQFYPVSDSQPWVIINGVDGDLWFTDQKKTRLLRLVNSAPRVLTGAVAATGPTSGSAQAAVNPRGNPTQVFFDYGKTTAYGKSSAPVDVPNGADPVTVTGILTKLKSETTYHIRARAVSAEGTATGADATIKTPPFPELATNTSIRISLPAGGKAALVESITITRLRGTETATIRCKGGRCPFKVKRVKLPKGTKTFGPKLLKNRPLPPGTVLSVQVSAPRTIGTSTVMHVKKAGGGIDAPVDRACLRPGKDKPSKCP